MAEARDALRWLADPEVGNHSSVVGDFALEVVDACHAVAEFRCDCPVKSRQPGNRAPSKSGICYPESQRRIFLERIGRLFAAAQRDKIGG